MAEIRNLTRNGETFYPLTCSDAVLNRDGEPLGPVNDIFDISEYNASGTPPTLAKYSTLALALAAVPQSKQKGGMTIRYVQTSDNKYVQYMYIGTVTTGTPNPFLIIDNWEKINLEDNVTQLEIKVDGVEANYTPGYYINSAGTITQEGGTFVSDFIPVSNGDVIKYGYGYQYLCVYASDKTTYIDRLYAGEPESTMTINSTSAAFVRAGFRAADFNNAYIKINNNVVFTAHGKTTGLLERVSNIEGILPQKADKSELTELTQHLDSLDGQINGTRNYINGVYLLQDGSLQEESTSLTTLKIPASYNDQVDFAGYKSGSYIIAYDNNDNILETWSARPRIYLNSSASSNVSYIKASFDKNAAAFIKINGSIVWTPQVTPNLRDDVTQVAGLVPKVESLEVEVENKANSDDLEDLERHIYGVEQNYTDGYHISGNGMPAENGGAFICDYIPVANGDIVNVHHGYQYLALYDSAKEYLDRLYVSNDDLATYNVNNANAAFIRCGFKKSNIEIASIDVNDVVVFTPEEYYKGLTERIQKLEGANTRRDVFNVVGNNYSTPPINMKCIPGHHYILVPAQLSWARTNISEGSDLLWMDSNLRTNIIKTKEFPLQEEYTFTAGDGETDFILKPRADKGVSLTFTLYDLESYEIPHNTERIVALESRLDNADILDLYPDKDMLPILTAFKYNQDPNTMHPYAGTSNPLSLLFFSDLHSCVKPLERLIKFFNHYNSHFDACICGGDVKNEFIDDYSYWGDSGANRIIPVLGNHDVMDATGSVTRYVDGIEVTDIFKFSPKECYDIQFKPFLSQLNLTNIPENKCYWYKDFADSSIRIIGIDDYHWKRTIDLANGTQSNVYPDGQLCDTGEQQAWFINTLSDARTLGYSVIVVRHNPVKMVSIQCPFTNIDFPLWRLPDVDPSSQTEVSRFFKEPVQAVQDFIDAGGIFIGWLTGHWHQDALGVIKGYPKQFQMTIDTLRWGNNYMGQPFVYGFGETPHVENTRSADCMEIVNVNPHNNTLTLFRVGSNRDRVGRKIGAFVWNYSNRQMVYCE
jgi:hypothetical protein